MKCDNHKWVKLYYRKQGEKPYQEWILLKDKVICQKCEQIAELKI